MDARCGHGHRLSGADQRADGTFTTTLQTGRAVLTQARRVDADGAAYVGSTRDTFSRGRPPVLIGPQRGSAMVAYTLTATGLV
jgi:hypothetical protein